MLVRAIVRTPWYDQGGRKYLNLEVDGKIHRVKVPFRYNRVMCRVSGLTPIQSIAEGSVIQCLIERKLWEGETHWILHSVTT
jgi:hypothetical protein